MGKRKSILLIAFSIVAILITAAFFVLWNPQPPAFIALPVPNGYDAFLQAGALVQQQTGNFTKMNEVELHDLVEANSNALQVARAGLMEKSRVPLQFSEQFILNHSSEALHIRLLAEAFAAQGRLAEMEQRTNDAARAYLDAARLGINSRQGGMLIDAMLGCGTEGLGTTRLQNIVPSLDSKTSVEMAKELGALETNAESWEQVLENDKNWSRRAFPGLQYRMASLFFWNQTRANQVKAKKTFTNHESSTHRLILDLVAHAYQLDKGHRPTNVAELVPDYLKAAPIDPLTGKEMKLTP